MQNKSLISYKEKVVRRESIARVGVQKHRKHFHFLPRKKEKYVKKKVEKA